MSDKANERPDDQKASTKAIERVDPAPASSDTGDEPSGEEYFLFDEGHTARILTLDEVAAVAEGTYVPEGASTRGGPRQAGKVSSSPDGGDEGVILESFEFVTEGGRVLTADEVMDIVEGRAEMPD